ncbi:AMP-binding protein [Lactococcus lactis subsp. lactis]|uniref:AMP-binding protein n=1 Tax=Lactococcus TaxID=1357 RepID=UPI001CDC8394|nr:MULTISPECIES: AMP-binding protein [Lactococcus]MCA2390915.1 AMP-binding protein [Lactococcus sp. NH2-7C]WGV29735.1 AMP-binding protein [Lactococcus sp. NH2-7C]WKB48616.1 AMP-binding protein [Lactococcus lactis subsp. lactis]
MSDNLVLDKIEDFALSHPDKIAIVDQNVTLTYRNLVDEIQKVSRILSEKNLSDKIVAIKLPRGVYFPIVMLALTKEKITFIPLDISQPSLRINQLIQISGAQVIISMEKSELVFEETHVENKGTPHSWAVYFTSGSTGVPKAVQISWRNVENITLWQRDKFELSSIDRVAAFTPYTFAVSYMDIFPTLYAGATLYIMSEEIRHDLILLEDYLNDNSITFFNVTTLVGDLVIKTMELPKLRMITLSGQRFPNKKVKKRSYKILNVYGNTECGAVTVSRITEKTDKITIGKPAKGMGVLILDDNSQSVPDGEIGEIFVFGEQVSKGYFMNPEASQLAFVGINHLGKNIKGYRTGDYAKILPNGEIEYLGRKDRQYKINGNRIDLSEVEHAFYEVVPDSKQVHIGIYNNQIICWYINADLLDENELIEKLSKLLPEIMVPANIIQVEEFPTNSNGKVDENQLINSLKSKEYSQSVPQDKFNFLRKIWSDILNISEVEIGLGSDFRKMGATSLQIMELGVRILQDLGKKINFVDLYDHVKFEDMARFILKQENFQPIYTFVKRTPEMGKKPALFVIHSGNTGSDVYRPLFKNLINPEFPIYVIEPYNLLTTGERIEGIERLASFYLKLINDFAAEKSIRSFNLMGWSYGGVVATEICHQIEKSEEGKAIESLAILDSPFYLSQVDLDREKKREANGYYRKYFESTHIFEGMSKKNITTEHLIENNHQVFLDIFNYRVSSVSTPTLYVRSTVEDNPLSDENIHSIYRHVRIENVQAGHDYLFVDKDARAVIQSELGLKQER